LESEQQAAAYLVAHPSRKGNSSDRRA